MKNSSIAFMATALFAGLAVSQTAPEPIVAADWFPLVNGAILEYRNTHLVTSSSATVRVTSGQTFAGRSATRWAFESSCDRTAGKENWGTLNKSFGSCTDRDYFFSQDADGLRILGEQRFREEYGYAPPGVGNRAPYSRTSIYDSLSQPSLKNGYVPGSFSFRQSYPGVPGGWFNSKGNGESWGAPNVSISATYSASFSPASTSAYESRRDVGIYSEYSVPAGTFRTLYVEDAVVDVAFRDTNS